MKIKVHGSELNRIMKTITQCVESKVKNNNSNVQICHENNLLTFRATNGVLSAVMHTPLLGGDGEKFHVDGAMFAKVVSMCNGETEISTDGQNCTVKCAGRTKLPIINATISEIAEVSGSEARVSSDGFARCLSGVGYAVSADQTRIQLTGVLVEAAAGKIRAVGMDGFQMSIEETDCEGDDLKVIVPIAFMKMVAQAAAGEAITLRTDRRKIQAVTDSMVLGCSLIGGEYIDYKRLLPTEFKTECLVDIQKVFEALKSCSVINNKQNLVKLEISEDGMRVTNNSEQADFEAEIPCGVNGNKLLIAFNLKYLMNTINTVPTEEATMRFTSPVSPCIIQGKDEDGLRLLLPVRTQGV